jgi:hypothetical protein
LSLFSFSSLSLFSSSSTCPQSFSSSLMQ